MDASQNQPLGATVMRIGEPQGGSRTGMARSGRVAGRGAAYARACRKTDCSVPARTGIRARQLLLAILTFLFLASAARAQETALYFTSSSGDYIGQGRHWSYTPADVTFAVERNFDNGVSFRITNFDASPSTFWNLDFAAPNNATLTPGEFPNATRYPFQAAAAPGLSLGGNGRGCNMLTGSFTVLEAVYDADGNVTSFAADFIQHCEGGTSSLAGGIRFNSSIANPAPALSGVSPVTIESGTETYTLEMSGSNFIPGSVVRWDGSDRPTAFESSSLLTAVFSAADLEMASSARVTVFNPGLGGSTSNSLSVAVESPGSGGGGGGGSGGGGGAGTISSSGAVRANPGFQANSTPRNDDGSSAEVPLGFEIDFFGERFSSAYVNTNGNITFGGSLATFTPQGLAGSPLRIIAPYWADVDTRGARSALVTHGIDTVDGHRAFGANWVNVGYFGSHDDKLNSFQLVLIEREDIGPGNFDIEFNYDRILWETGDASSGSGGLGGTSASAGYSNGSGKPEGSFEILGSRLNGIFLDNNRHGLRYRRLNSTVRGRLVFHVRQGSVECTYGALSIDEIFPWQGGTGTVQVAAPSGCEWSAVSNTGFVTISSGGTGSGNGLVEYLVAENRGARPRSGTLTVAGEVIPVQQEAFVTLRVTPPHLQLSSVEGKFPDRVVFEIDPIEEEVSWSASAKLLNGDVWRFRATPDSGTATKAEPSFVVLELNPSLTAPLPGAVYEAVLTVRDTVEGPSVEVPLILSVSRTSGNLELSQSSFVFRASEGGPSPAPQTLQLTNSGSGALSWFIPPGSIQSAPWLSVSDLTGNAITGSPQPSSLTLTVNSAGLAAGTYQTLMELASPAGTGHPQFVTVTLHVVPATVEPIPAISPGGLLFVAQQGGAAPPARNLTVSNNGSGDLRFDLSTDTLTGGNWLRVTASANNTGSGPATIEVAANPTGLPPGIYQGSVAADFSTDAGTSVPVFLIVSPVGQKTLFGTTICTPDSMAAIPVSVSNNLAVSATFPQPLMLQALDSCGKPVDNALILASVEGNQIVLQPVGRGLYSAIWTPQIIAPVVPVKFTVLHALYGITEGTINVATTDPPGGVLLPSLSTNGVVDSAGFAQGLPLAPGSIISIFGSGLAEEEAAATQLPLGRELGGVSVTIGREEAPLFYVGPGQINAQVPFSLVPGSTATVVVNSGGKLSAPQQYLVAPVQPNIFDQNGTAFATDAESQRISPENPARPGTPIQIFATGLGLVDQAVATGAASPPSSSTLNPVRVKIGGIDAPVSYQGLAPGFVGLYQINVFLPGIVKPSNEVPVVIQQNGIPSNASFPVTIPVQNP